MGKKLTIWLPDDWTNTTDQYPEGLLTFSWNHPDATGAFQVSTAEYVGGAEPRPSEADLIQFAVEFGQERQWGQLIGSFSGNCVMGTFGTAAFKQTDSINPDAPAYSQLWLLSNGLDFVYATFLAMKDPRDREVGEAQRIAEGIDFR